MPEVLIRNIEEEAIILQNIGPRYVDSVRVYFGVSNRVLWTRKAEAVFWRKQGWFDLLGLSWRSCRVRGLLVCYVVILQQASTLYGHHQVKGKVIPVQAEEALSVARGWGSHIFTHSAHRWQQVCQSYAPAAFYPHPRTFLVLKYVIGWVDLRAIMRLEGLGKLKKNPSHPGLESATFQLVA
jgi:hypothetical protein